LFREQIFAEIWIDFTVPNATIAALDALWGSALYSQFSHRRATILFVAGVTLVQVALSPSVHAALLGMAARAGWFARRHGREFGLAGVLLAALVVLAVSAATLDSRGRRQGIRSCALEVGRFIAQELDRARIGFWRMDQGHLQRTRPGPSASLPRARLTADPAGDAGVRSLQHVGVCSGTEGHPGDPSPI
jgi:hypothetical protein